MIRVAGAWHHGGFDMSGWFSLTGAMWGYDLRDEEVMGGAAMAYGNSDREAWETQG